MVPYLVELLLVGNLTLLGSSTKILLSVLGAVSGDMVSSPVLVVPEVAFVGETTCYETVTGGIHLQNVFTVKMNTLRVINFVHFTRKLRKLNFSSLRIRSPMMKVKNITEILISVISLIYLTYYHPLLLIDWDLKISQPRVMSQESVVILLVLEGLILTIVYTKPQSFCHTR